MKLEEELPALDVALREGNGDAWRHLASLQARFAYIARWQSQIRERLLQLM